MEALDTDKLDISESIISNRLIEKQFELRPEPTITIVDDALSNANSKFFQIAPLEKGFGHTLGSSIRRVLMNNYPGYAVSGIKISYESDGHETYLAHEYDTLPGVLEEITQILDRIKSLALKITTGELSKIISFSMDKGTYTVGDISEAFESKGVKLLNNLNEHFITIVDDISVNMDLQVDAGRSYVTSEEIRKYIRMPYTIPLDCSFNPILRVVYTVEPFRVGEYLDNESLHVNIETNNTVTPEEALVYGLKYIAGISNQIVKNRTEYADPYAPDNPAIKVLNSLGM